MIILEHFTYSDAQWDAIKTVVPDALRHAFDQITRRSMETAASAYLPQAALNRQRLSRDELETLRDDAANLRAGIAGAMSVHLGIKNVGPLTYSQRGVDGDMMNATGDYFAKLARNLDRMIAKAETRNARKIEREELWSQLLAPWIDIIGGDPTGKATANFLIAAAAPIDADADIEAVEKWLKRRRQSKTTKQMQRRRAIRGQLKLK
jgi:hypothetical protein